MADPGISERGGGGGGLYTIVVTFNVNGVEGELQPLLRGPEPCPSPKKIMFPIFPSKTPFVAFPSLQTSCQGMI